VSGPRSRALGPLTILPSKNKGKLSLASAYNDLEEDAHDQGRRSGRRGDGTGVSRATTPGGYCNFQGCHVLRPACRRCPGDCGADLHDLQALGHQE